MTLSSATFLGFLLVCAAANYLLPGRLRNFWLLLSSVAFFLYAMPGQTFLMMVFVLAVYLGALWMHRREGKARKALLILLLTLCVGFLLFYKYLRFGAGLLGLNTDSPVFHLVVPMGISYVTFQCIAYLVEVYRRNMEPERQPVDFFVYALFFAKVTAGPIEAPGTFLAQLKQERPFDNARVRCGLMLLVTGFVKKIVVADLLAPGVAAVYATGGAQGAWSVLIATVLYAIQILYDFSGYTDIARGAGLIMGLELTENFRRPYAAASVREFWRRWHISLSDWLKRYVYIPLGGSRVGTARRYLNIFLTFLVSGLWHGASVNFLIWGCLHGVYQILEILLEKPFAKLRGRAVRPVAVAAWAVWDRVRTFCLVSFAWMFFRADSLATVGHMLAKFFTHWGSLPQALALCGVDAAAVVLVAVAMTAVFLLSQRLHVAPRERRIGDARMLLVGALAAWAVILVSLLLSASGAGSSFIYFDF